ncbi:MAG TPA: DoxX family protein [Candidatus Kryptonia bacterium]
MEHSIESVSPKRSLWEKKGLWTGRIMSGLAVLFMLFDSITKVMKVAPVMKASAQLGYPAEAISAIGIILLACVIVYVVPRTSIIGAILLTGYLGGAVASNLRIGTPLFSNVLFPVYFAVLVWGGLYLRKQIVRSIFSLRKA